MLLLAAFAFSQCKGMSTIDKKHSERSAKYNKLNSSPVVSSAKSTPSKDLVSPSSHLYKSNSTSKHQHLARHHSNSKKRRHISSEEDDVWTEHISSSGRIYYYNRKTDESQWEKPKGYVKKYRQRLKSDPHSKGEIKSHSKLSDAHSKPLDSHFKSVDSHSKSADVYSKSADVYSKSADYHSDRKHSHYSGMPNKHHHRDHRHGNSEHRSSSGANAHRSSAAYDKKPSEHMSSSRGSTPQFSKPSRTPQKVSTGSESCLSPIQQDVSIPCSSPMVQHHHHQQQQQLHHHQHTPQQLCPMALKPMIPCQYLQQQQQHEQQNFPPTQPHQFMSPQQQQQLSFMSHSNGPPREGGGMVAPYRPWPATHLPPMQTREQGAFPPAVSPLLPAVFSPGGGPPGRGEHLLPHPTMSMDNLSQGLHPLQQAFLLQNQQHQHSQMVTPVNTPGGTPISTPCKPLLPELSLAPLPSKNTPHTPTIHAHSNPGTPHLHKQLGGTVPYQLFSEQQSRPSFDRTHSIPASSKDLMEQFQTESKLNMAGTSDLQAGSNVDINESSKNSEAQEAEQQKIQIGMDYFNKPLTEFWITPAYETLEKQLCQSSVDSLTHKHIEGRRLNGVVKRFSIRSSTKQLRSFAVHKKVEGVRKIIEEFLNKR